MRTKTAARCASRSLRAHRLDARGTALARLALLLLGALLGSCIGPGLEPPGGGRAASDQNVTPPPATPDAGTGPGFGNTGSDTDDGETMAPDPTAPPTTDPDPQTPPPSGPNSSADDDAGTDTADESP